MRQIALIALVCLVSTVVAKNNDDTWTEAEDPPNTDDKFLRDMFERAAVNYGTWRSDNPDADSSVQKDTSDDTVFAKSLPDRIVGGSIARHGEIPWQASIKSNVGWGFNHHCGAAIIDQLWLISAAHCYKNVVGSKWRVTVGEHHLNRPDAGEQTFDVDRIYNHENYIPSPSGGDYDIALIRIRPSRGQGIVFNNYVQPIRLPAAGTSLPDGAMLLVSGWGGTLPCEDCLNDPQISSDVLLKAEVPIVSLNQCKKVYRPGLITNQMICAGFAAGGVDACQGDSGGPAAYRMSGQYVLHGIVSFGAGCAQPNAPGVYARVTSFLPWIARTKGF